MDTLTPIVPIIPVEQQQIGKEKHVGGRPLGPVWQHFSKKNRVSPGNFKAECKYCLKTWKCEEVPILGEYLASHCSNVPRPILREYT